MYSKFEHSFSSLLHRIFLVQNGPIFVNGVISFFVQLWCPLFYRTSGHASPEKSLTHFDTSNDTQSLPYLEEIR